MIQILPADQILTHVKNPKGKVSRSRANPPHVTGLIILFLVSLEMVLARHLMHGQGGIARIIPETIGTVLFIGIIELVLLSASHGIADMFEKRGKIFDCAAFLNLSLAPLLLFLPVTLVIWASGMSQVLRVLFLLALVIKILSDWNRVIHTYYKFKKWQTALVYLSIGGLLYLMGPIFFLLSLLKIA